MFAIGDTVMHPSEGVCNVENVTPMRFAGMPARDYYVLKPAMEKASNLVYMPLERGDVVLRRLLSRRDIVELIDRSKTVENFFIEDSRMRKDAFQKILSSCDYARIIRVIVLLHEERERRVASGRKPCASDEALLTHAERLLHQEFSYVLHMNPEETVAFIREELEKAE